MQRVGESDGDTTDVSSVSDASEASSVLSAGDAFTLSHASSASEVTSSIEDSDGDDEAPPSRLNRFAMLSLDDGMSTSDSSVHEHGSDIPAESIEDQDLCQMGSGVYTRLQEVCRNRLSYVVHVCFLYMSDGNSTRVAAAVAGLNAAREYVGKLACSSCLCRCNRIIVSCTLGHCRGGRCAAASPGQSADCMCCAGHDCMRSVGSRKLNLPKAGSTSTCS